MLYFLVWLLRPTPVSTLAAEYPLPPCSSECTIDVNPSVLARSGDPLHLEWSVESDNESDWIGFFAPPFRSPSYDDYVMRLKPHLIGASEHTLSLANLRAPFYDIRYISAATGQCLCRTDERVRFEMGPHEPTQGHVTMDTTTGALRVHWVSGDPNPGFVEYKAAGDADWSMRHATVATYDFQDMCAGDMDNYYDPGYFYSATMPAELKGEVTVRFGSVFYRSEAFTIATPVLSGSDEVHSVALFGDMGVQSFFRGPDKVEVPNGRWDTYWVQDHMRANPRLRMAVHFGDVSYAMGRSRVWDLFGTAVEDVAMRMPYMVSIGNHEFDYVGGGWHPSWGNFGMDSGGECGVPTKYRYQFPYWWYAFSFGLVRYVMLSSEHDWTEGSEQWQWLDEQLAEVDRSVTPWVIVTAHRPMLVSGYDPSERAVEDHMYPALGPLLKKHRVNLFVAGHWHYYERTHPVDGTVHVLAGSAGAYDLHDVFEDLPRVAARWPDVRGYLELKVTKDELEGTFWGINNSMTDRRMAVFDHFTVAPWADGPVEILHTETS
ncbi:hypothetical protein FOZ63_010411 [Perkinsus olseni]|uniref:Purple acid phosphatase n=1 Tax=Perkinsus olseni TaxID=32597 RepID=A0A7J6TKT3_PEROL|nr:hypothetical protein FOZ62_001812 [Perkinsus olseni]KAF4745447.1 hypothetical protein FOZ63_010411 [Perkinsus olseni]